MIKKLIEYSKAFVFKYLSLFPKEALLKLLLFEQTDYSPKEPKWHIGFITLRESLFENYIAALSSLIKDNDPRVASYSNIYNLIFTDEAQKVLLQFYKTPIKQCEINFGVNFTLRMKKDHVKSFNKERTAKRLENYNLLLDKVKKGAKAVLNDSTITSLYNLRSKIVSHFEMKSDGTIRRLWKVDEFNLKWGDPFKFSKRIEENINDIYQLINDSTYYFDIYREECIETAKIMYSKLIS